MMALDFFTRRLALPWSVVVCCGLAAETAMAQDSPPHIGYVYPAGGQQGTTVQVTIGGQRLGEATDAYISGLGAKAELVPSEPIPTGKQVQELRNELQKLREERKTDDQAQEIKEIRHKLALFERSKVTPAIGETAVVKVTLKSGATPGNREIRLNTVTGLSNPLVFQVGEYPEARKTSHPLDDDFNRIRNSIANQELRYPPARAKRTPVAISLPATLNGQLLPGDVDRYQFQAEKGQKLVVVASARELIPYIADAVPGWVQLSIALFDSQGKELVCAEEWQLNADPVLRYDIPADGDYTIEICDAIHRGREDFIYRVRLGEIPWVTSAFPLGGPVGTTTTVELLGWNLPTSKLSLDARGKKPGVYPLSAGTKDNPLPNLVHLEVGSLPETFEKQPNDSIEHAQSVTLPIIVNGRIDHPGDVDVYSFYGPAGATLIAEIDARRLDSQLDSTLTLLDAKGQPVAFNDDHEDKVSGLLTHHADSYLSHKVIAPGRYYVQVADAQQKGGPDYGYRLRLSLPQPDFALRVTPSMINFRPNATQAVTVHILRREGFKGEIELTLKEAPAGFSLSGGAIPADRDKAKFTVTAPATLPKGPASLKLIGSSTYQKKLIEHPVISAEDEMQAFFNRHLVPCDELLVSIEGKATSNVPAKIVDPTPLEIPTQGTVSVKLSTPVYTSAEMGQLKLVDPPEGITMKGASWGKVGVEITFEANPEKVKPGTKGNLLVSFGVKEPKRIPLGYLPAIAYELAGSAADDGRTTTETAPAGFNTLRPGIARGKVERIEYQTKLESRKYRASVYLPAGYSPDTKYPALYLLHEAGGDENSWTRTLHADAILDNLLAGKAEPMIAVMPAILSNAAHDKLGSDAEATTREEAKFGKVLFADLLPYIEANYSVRADRQHRALAGYAEGADQAFSIGLAHSQMFAWIGVFSGGDSKSLTTEVVTKIRQSSATPRLLWLSVGDQDTITGENVATLNDVLTTYKLSHTFRIIPGGHEPKVWMNDLYFFAPLIFKPQTVGK